VKTPLGAQSEKKAVPPALQEAVQLLRRALDSLRTYRSSHQVAKLAMARAHAKWVEAIDGPQGLQLEVTLGSLLFEDTPLSSQAAGSGRREDPLALPLFNEGVRRLTFVAPIVHDELTVFLDAWLSAAASPSASQSVTTRLWEAELKTVQLVVIDSFALSDDVASTEASAGGPVNSFRQQVDALINAIASEGHAGGSDAKLETSVLRVSAEDIELLRAEGVRDITAEQLSRQESGGRTIEGLSDEDRDVLARELTVVRHDPAERFATALVNAALLSGGVDAKAATERLQALLKGLVETGQLKEALDAYQRLVAQVKEDQSLGSLRAGVVARLKPLFLSDWFVERLMFYLDAEEVHLGALYVLQVVGKSLVKHLTAWLPRLKTQGAKKAVAAIVAEAGAAGLAMGAQVKAMDATSFQEVMMRFRGMAPDEVVQVLAPALNSLDVEVRRLAMRALTPAVAVRVPRGVLQARLNDPDPQLRADMLRLVVRLEDPTAVPSVVALLKRPTTPADERVRLAEALGTLGGPQALQALTDGLEKQSEVEVRCACALALGASRDPLARAPLEAAAGRFLTLPRLRAAVQTALKTLETPL
jgi:hypothetical protein